MKNKASWYQLCLGLGTLIFVSFFLTSVAYEPLRSAITSAQVRASVAGPFNTGGADYYVVTSANAAEDTGDEVCATLGLECLGYTQFDDSICMAVHPGATQVTDVSGDRSAVYCDGAPQGGICAGLTNTCLECPTCSNSVSCAEAIGGLYREMYVQCGAAVGTSEITRILKVSNPALTFVGATVYDPIAAQQFAVVRNTLTDSNTVLSSIGNDDQAMGIAADALSNMFVVYGEDNSGSDSYDIYLAKLSSTGTIVWDRLLSGLGGLVNFHSVNGFLDVVPDEAGGAFVLLTVGDDLTFTSPTLYHVTSAGTISPGYPVTFAPNTADLVGTAGNAVLVLSNLGENQDTFDLGSGVVERYTSAGLDATWNGNAGSQDVSTNITSIKSGGAAMADGNDGIVILWGDDEPGEAGVYGQRIDSDGNLGFDWVARGNLLVSTSDFVEEISVDLFGRAFAAYKHAGGLEAFDFDIGGGSRSWTCNQSITATVYDFQLVADDTYGPYLLWHTDSGLDTGLFAQSFDAFTGHSNWALGGVLVDDAVSNAGTNFNITFGNKISGSAAQHDAAAGVDVYYSYNDAVGQPVSSTTFDGTTFPAGPGNDCIPVAAPVQVLPADNATVSLKPYLSAQYISDIDLGVTHYRVSSSSLADCVNNVNVVYSADSQQTTTLNEATGIVVETSIADGSTYYWCAQNEDVSLFTSDWTQMGAFTVDLTTPHPDYSTYLGGAGDDSPSGIALGADGIVYITGSTSSLNFPTTAGVYDETDNSSTDVFLTALDLQSGGAADLVFSTYLGGTGDDSGRAVAVDGTGVYVVGNTSSTNFPTTGGAYDTANAGTLVVSVSKLNLTGTTLAYSTYVGTGNNVQSTDMAVESGDIYVSGNVFGSSLPATAGAFDTALDTSQDGFLFQLSPDGAGAADLVYATYFGGNSNDESIETLTVNGGLIYFGMYTTATNMPTTAGALDTTDNTSRDGYIGRLDPAGAGAADLTYGSYLGGNGANDVVRGVSFDAGTIYATGFTNSSDFPTSAGAYLTVYPGASDGFIVAINPAGTGASDLTYGTYTDGLTGFNIEPSGGFLYVFGRVGTALSTTANAFDAVLTSTQSAFGVMKVDPSGAGAADLLYASLIESNDVNSSAQPANNGLVFDTASESMIFTGEMTTKGYPALAVGGQPYDLSYNSGNSDVIVTRFTFADGVPNPPVAPVLHFPDNGAVRAGTVALSAIYEHDLLVGTTDYRVSSSSTADCVNNVNIVDSGASAATTTIDEPTTYTVAVLGNGTYFWCARNNDGTQQSAWTAMGSFIKDNTAPYVNYSTYLGGSDIDDIDNIYFDGTNLVFVGTTRSNDLPVTVGVYDATLAGAPGTFDDIFVGTIEFAGNGSADIIELTYLGGTASDYATGVRVSAGDVYVAGRTQSADFPTTGGAYDTTHNGDNDMFAARLSGDLSALEYSTFIGTAGFDTAFDFQISGGQFYIGGQTSVTGFPTTAGAYDTTFNTNNDVLMVLLNPAGTGAADLVYSTYIGGSGHDRSPSVDVYNGKFYFTCETFSLNFPTTAGAYDAARGGSTDAIFAVLNPGAAGSADLEYASYFGGAGSEDPDDSTVDPLTGKFYASIETNSADFPTTLGAYDTTYNTFADSSVVVFNPAGGGSADLEYSTYLGGTNVEFAASIAVLSGEAYLVGYTTSNDYPVTSATAYGNNNADNADAFFARLNPAGAGAADLVYATYIGNRNIATSLTNIEDARSVFVSGTEVYISGITGDYGIETLADGGTPAYATPNGLDDSFIMRLDFAGAVSNSAPTAPTTLFSNNADAQLGSANPTGITSSTPVFSAICNDPDVGDIMDLYRVQVDDNNDFSSILWDSGALGTAMANCVAGARSANITFGGAALAQDGATYFWRIKFWDDEPSEGSFSEAVSTNTFTMATSGGGSSLQRLQQQASLAVPTAGLVTVLGTDSVKFDWSYSGTNHIGFRLINDEEQIVTQVNGESRTATETGLSHNMLVAGRKVAAYSSTSESAPSSTYPDVYTEIIPVTPVLVSRVADRVRVQINEEVNNLVSGQSGIQFELMPVDNLTASTVAQSEWLKIGSHVFEGTDPALSYYARSRSRNASGVETPWSSNILIEGGEELIADVELLLSLSVLTADGMEVSGEQSLNPNELMYGELTLVNNGSQAAGNVFLALPLPQYLTYVPGSLSVDGHRQSDTADGDVGQAANDVIAAIWPVLDFGFGHTVRFTLAFDTPRLVADFVQPTRIEVREDLEDGIIEDMEEGNETETDPKPVREIPKEPIKAPDVKREDFIELTPEQEALLVPTEQLREVLAQAIAAAGPELTLQASASHEGDEDPVYSNPVIAEPELDVFIVQAPVAEPDPVVEDPVAPSPDEIAVIEEIFEQEFPGTPGTTSSGPGLQTGQTTSSFDGGSFSVGVDGLNLTGSAVANADQIEFTGTTSQPFTIITLIFNGDTTSIAVSDAEGQWRTFVDAETLGIQPGQQATVNIEAIAAKGTLRSERVSVGEVTVTRGQTGDVVADFETIVSDNAFVTAINEIRNETVRVIEEQQPEIQTVLTAAAPLIVVSSVPLWGYLPYIPTLIYHFMTWLIGLVGRKKKDEEGKTYGVIYDSISKQPLPLAIVRVYAETKLVTTVVTDKLGRYDLLLPPGTYRLEVSKPQYQFPSQIVTTTIDGEFNRVYQPLKGMSVQEQAITIPHVPVDPVNSRRDWELSAGLRKIWLSIQRVGHYLATPLLVVGLLSSAALVYAVPDKPMNWFIVALYVLLLVSQLKFGAKAIKAWGVVYDLATNAVLPLTTIQLIDPAYSKVVTSRLTDYEGRFSFLPEPGNYVVKATKPGYEQVKEVVESHYADRQPMAEQVRVDKPDQRIAGDVAMKQQG